MFMTSNQLHAVHEVTKFQKVFVHVFSSGENISKIIWENGVVLILSRFRLCLCVQKLSHISPLFHGTELCHFKKRGKTTCHYPIWEVQNQSLENFKPLQGIITKQSEDFIVGFGFYLKGRSRAQTLANPPTLWNYWQLLQTRRPSHPPLTCLSHTNLSL